MTQWTPKSCLVLGRLIHDLVGPQTCWCRPILTLFVFNLCIKVMINTFFHCIPHFIKLNNMNGMNLVQNILFIPPVSNYECYHMSHYAFFN